MEFLQENWHLLFGGVGTAIVAALVGAVLKSRGDAKGRQNQSTKPTHNQSARADSEAVIVQAGRDARLQKD